MDNQNTNPVHLDPDYEPMSNASNNTHFASILEARMARRGVLKGGLAAAMTGLFGGLALTGCGSSSSSSETGVAPQLVGFKAIPVSDEDTIVVPEGYSAHVITRWGDPISANNGVFPEFDPLTNTGADQAHQIGSHHDGMHFFPIEGEDPNEGSSTDGLLVMNHEYIEPRFMHASAVGASLTRSQFPRIDSDNRDDDEVLKELNAHGVSVVRVQKGVNGTWSHVQGDSLNRRITGLTPMEISGPVRGTDWVKTKYSPTGTMTRGTLNNCAHGVTPWNTYMAAEENWAGYFVNTGLRPESQSRYGVRASGKSRYAWEDAQSRADEYVRFNATPGDGAATEDYRNEPHCFGWMVEIDPFDATSTPIKRTALGRFAHEGVVFAPAIEGRPVVCYSGDDARNEYIYKFVSAQPYHKATAGGYLLDSGTLYVAKFNDDGSGEWLPLVFGQGPLTPANGFDSQADVLVKTRSAADAVGATKMDRPEWGAVDPNTREVYFTLTNNSTRAETDAANPRAQSRWGHIIKWQEGSEDNTATTFNWDIFILAGPTDDSDFNGQPLNDDQIFNSPDGLWIDKDSRVWIQTDISESVMNTGDWEQFGNNQMLAADPRNGVLRRFLTGPIGQEITGVITTPDQRTMFINVQHPGATTTAAEFAAGNMKSEWPDRATNYPRSATVVITKDDGGIIGT